MRVIDWNTSLKWEESCREGERASEKGEKRGEKKEEGGDMMERGIKTIFVEHYSELTTFMFATSNPQMRKSTSRQ